MAAMANSVLYPHITDRLAAEHPEWVQWSDQHGWLPRVAGGADGDDDGDGGDGSDGVDDQDRDNGADDGSEDDGKGSEGKLSQAEVDAIIEKRLGQAKKAWEKDQADAAEKAKMTEAEKAKAEKAEAEKAAEERTATANARVIRSEAKVAAVAAGVRPDRAKAFLRVVDLEGIEVDDDGEPDAKAIAKAVKSTLEDFPEFKGAAGGKGPSGGDHGDEPKKKPTTLAGAVENHYAAD